MERFSYKVGVAYVNIRLSKHLKEELVWAIDERLRSISNIKQLSLGTLVPNSRD